MFKVPYSSAIESLMYVIMSTCLDICYVVGFTRRFQSYPDIKHWMVVKRIFRYLKGTKNYVLCYQGRDLQLIGYMDADWGGDPDQCKSTFGYVFLLNDCAISWGSKKQSCIALSTMEVEHVACSSAIQEVVLLRSFLQDIGVVKTAFEPVTLYCDSMAALTYAKEHKYHGKTKHIQIRYHFVRDMITQNKVVLKHIPTNEMVAGPFIKPIARDAFVKHVRSLGLCRI